jgi:glycosyltransferase involved in cell wall biosynthesis
MLSVITPVLNAEKFIEENIRAIQKLSIPYEHIIVDGNSTDRTIDIVSLFPDVKVIVQKAKTGMYGAINDGIMFSKGEYVTYINCDDIIDPVNFSLMYKEIAESSSDFIYSDGYLKYLDTGKIEFYKSSKLLFKYFLRNGIMPFNQPCSIYSRKVFDKVGGFDADTFRNCGDLDFFRKITQLSDAKIKYLALPTVTFLIHSESLTSAISNDFDHEYRNGSIPIPNLINRSIYFLSRLLKI